MKFPVWIAHQDQVYEIVGMVDKDDTENMSNSSKYQQGKGYVDENDTIWIFSATGKPERYNACPYFWFEDESKIFSDPGEETLNHFNIANATDISLSNISATTHPDEVLYNEKALYDMNAKAEIYKPEEKENDDFLKKVIKRIIIRKNVDTARLKHKTEQRYSIPNMRQALQTDEDGKPKMSTNYFSLWSELLGFDFLLVAMDNGTDMDTLGLPVLYSSHKDGIFLVKEMNVVFQDEQGNEFTQKFDRETLAEQESKRKHQADGSTQHIDEFYNNLEEE